MAQVPTKIISAKTLMSRPIFQRGYTEAMYGTKFAADYDDWPASLQWTYERGRQFYFAAGRVRLKQGRGVSSQAIEAYRTLRNENVIL
jgi:hypothetical protein